MIDVSQQDDDCTGGVGKEQTRLILTETGKSPKVSAHFHQLAAVFQDILSRERALGIPPGMPVLVSTEKLDDRLNVYFRHGFPRDRMSTARTYAKELRTWLRFIEARGIDWDEARREDVRAFQMWRVYDEGNPRRITPATWNKSWAALRHFYAWAYSEGWIELDLVGEQDRLRDAVAPSGFREKNARSSRDRWLTPAEYALWRDVGVRGYEARIFNGRVVAGLQKEMFRGRDIARNAAFADYVLATGLRKEEAGTLLEMEVPASVGDKVPIFGKGGVFRHYEVLHQMGLVSVRDYVEGERRDAVRRAQREDTYEGLPHPIQIAEVLPGGRRGQRVRLLDGRIANVSMMTTEERYRLLIQGPGGLEPASLWLTGAGTPLLHTSWNSVFNAANSRVSAGREDLSVRSPWVHVTPHSLRFTFALMVLVAGVRATDEMLVRGPADPFIIANYMHVFEEVRDLLGHAFVALTIRTYLEPVKGLRRSSLFRGTSVEEVWDGLAAASPLIGFGGGA